jgi:opacity protein-like surface antigen
MKHQKVKLIAALLLCLSLTGLKAQVAVPAAGGNASGAGGTASYSIGQVAYSTYTGATGSVAQGVQQPFEISVVTGIEPAKGITLECTAYPNPATDYLTLQVGSFDLAGLAYQLFDMNGKLITNKKLEGTETRISMGSLVPATYILKVVQNNQEVKTFKIIKN